MKRRTSRTRRRTLALLGVVVGVVAAFRQARLQAADIAFPEASRQR